MNRIRSFARTHAYQLTLVAIVTLIAAPLLVVDACGPDFEPDTFVPPRRPVRIPQYLRGQLGVLQSTYYIAGKVAAFRYLNGGTLDASERRQWMEASPEPDDWEHLTPSEYQKRQAVWEAEMNNTAPKRWSKARAAFPDAPAASPKKNPWDTDTERNGWGEYAACTASAYETAITTMQSRARLWGTQSEPMREWLRGQDKVFAYCTEQSLPSASIPLPVNSPLLLKQDRAYQMAAAYLYAEDFDKAEQAFISIGQDNSSPWHKWGEYLAGRALLRKAAKTVGTDPNSSVAIFDPASLRAARDHFYRVGKMSKDPEMRDAAQEKLNFIAVRLEPRKRAAELASLLAGPGHDPHYMQDLVDLRWMLDHGIDTGDPELVRWMRLTGTSFGDIYGDADKHVDPSIAEKAIAEWRAHPTMPWLVGSLQAAKVSVPALLQAASHVPSDSPAYLAVQYERARLLAETDPAQSRQVATIALRVAEGQRDFAASNAMHAARIKSAAGLHEFLTDAPRMLVRDTASWNGGNAKCNLEGIRSSNCTNKVPRDQFDDDVATGFNNELPLSMWLQAASDPALPQNLQRAVARAGWLRAAILDDTRLRRGFIELLSPDLRNSLTSAEPAFADVLTVLRSPGIQPELGSGVQRNASYSSLDSYRNNLWCPAVVYSGKDYQPELAPRSIPETKVVRFLTAEQRAQARREQQRIAETAPMGTLWAGERAMQFVRTHPTTPQAAEALALIVRATRYVCTGDQRMNQRTSDLSKEAFQLLHRRYANSEWAKKTKYYY